MDLLLLPLLLLAQPQVAQEPAPAGGWDDFPALLWCGTRFGEPTLELARAFGGRLIIGAREPSGDLPFLVFNAAGRDALHLDGQTPAARAQRARWIETRDDELLIRRPCLTAPETRAELFNTLRATLAARDGEQGLGVSLGDEVSLTPGGSPWDACLSPTCRAAWTAYLDTRPELDERDRARYANLAAVSTDAARAALAEGATAELEPWFLRRAFHRQVVTDLLLELAAEVRARRPEVPVGLLGVIGGTAFGGVDLDRLLPVLDFVECYPVSTAREQLFTSRGIGVRALQTVFPTARAPHRAAWRTFEHWMRGGAGVVVWSEREVRASPHARARIERAVADVRSLARRIGPFAPRPAGVALVHSQPSIALTWLREALLDGPTWPNRLQGRQEQDGARESSLRCWLRLLEDLRLMPGALDVDHIGASTAERFPVLVLHHLSVLDEAQVARLEQFLGAGGTLIVEGDLGALDTRGRPRDASLRESLAQRAPGRVLDAPRVVRDYATLRTTAPERAARGREEWWPTLAAAGVLGAPFAPFAPGSDDASTPWLCTWVADSRSAAWICAALPSTPGTNLRDRTLRIVVPADRKLEWLHPDAPEAGDQVVLPAGDAAVFRLVPRR